MDDVVAGRGRLVLLGGPAGIGKSRLADTAADLAERRGIAVARSYAIDDPGAPPLWPWTRLIRDWPGADALPKFEAGDAAARFTLFVTFADVLADRANIQPLLVILEDLHWADSLTLELLRHVTAGLAALPVGVLVTHRDSPIRPVLAELTGRDVARAVTLTGLSPAEVAAWLPDLIGHPDAALAAAVHEGTGGNPLLVRLAAQDPAMSGEVGEPRPALRALAAARLAVLDRPTRRVVEAAAVLGERVAPDILAEALGEPVDARIAVALSAGILRTDGDGIAFEHALVRDAVYAQTADRADVHRRIAAALAQQPQAPAGVVAMHWDRAGDVAECLGWAQRADEEARAALGYDEALRFAELALRCADDAARPEVLVRLAEAQFLAGRIDASLATCREAADAASAARRPDLLARAGLVIVGLGNPVSNRAVADICERALRELPVAERALRARLMAQIAVGMAETEGGSRCAEVAAEALAEADASGDAQAILEAVAARHLTISIPSTVAERLALGRRAIELGAAQQRTMPALWGRLWRADAALQLGNMAEFEYELSAIDEVARSRRSVLARWHHHRFSASRDALLGSFESAREHDRAALDIASRTGDMSLQGMSYAFRGQLAVIRGDPDESPEKVFDRLDELPPMPLVRVAVPTQLAVDGRLDEARAAFEPFRHLAAEFPVGVRWAATVAQIGMCAVLLDDAEVAALVHDTLIEMAHTYSGDGSGGVFTYGAVDGLLADLARVAGRFDAALRHYADAVPMNLRIGARPYVALNRLGWARTLLAAGRDRDQAAELLGLAVGGVPSSRHARAAAHR